MNAKETLKSILEGEDVRTAISNAVEEASTININSDEEAKEIYQNLTSICTRLAHNGEQFYGIRFDAADAKAGKIAIAMENGSSLNLLEKQLPPFTSSKTTFTIKPDAYTGRAMEALGAFFKAFGAVTGLDLVKDNLAYAKKTGNNLKVVIINYTIAPEKAFKFKTVTRQLFEEKGLFPINSLPEIKL